MTPLRDPELHDTPDIHIQPDLNLGTGRAIPKMAYRGLFGNFELFLRHDHELHLPAKKHYRDIP